MPIISEGIYWYTGSSSYTLGCVSFLITLGLLILTFTKRYLFSSKYIHLFITTLMLFVTIGFIELFMLVLLPISIAVYVIALKKRLDIKNTTLFILIVILLFSLFTYFAPGNAARASLFSNNHQFFYSVGMSLLQTVRFFLMWISSIPLLLLSVLYYFLNKKWSKNNQLFLNSFYLTPLTSVLLLFFVIFIGSFPAYWATGILGQHRTMNISYFMFIIMWFVSLTVFFNYNTWNFKLSKDIKWSIFMLLWISLIFTKNGYHVIIDLQSNAAYQYNKQMIERYSLLKNQKDTIFFEPIINPPKTLYVLDISEHPDYWTNKCYNVFFEVDNKIILK